MKSVLLADDNPTNRQMMKLWLEGQTSKIDLASTGSEALMLYNTAKLAGKPYDLLILDIAMPWKTGTTVLEEIRESGDWETPVVFHTALEPYKVEPDAKKWGAEVVYKPEFLPLAKYLE
jgi:CheY-like chemotaxis protein